MYDNHHFGSHQIPSFLRISMMQKCHPPFIEERTSTTEQPEELHHQLYPLNYADAKKLG